LNDEPLFILAVKRTDGGMNDIGQFRAGPVRLKHQIVGLAQGHQSAFDGQPALLQSLGGAQAL
jgi:hypothetical protein